LDSATSSAATKLEDLEGRQPEEEAVLVLLEGDLSVAIHGEQFLFF
jgi:hypothetical protein